MGREIWFLRHGKTNENDSGVIQSRTDNPLSEEGQEQARRFYAIYQRTKFDSIYTSPLIRTRQSVAGFLDRRENPVPHHVLDDLNDMRWGSEFIGMSLGNEKFRAVRRAWIEGQTNLRTERDGESPEDMDRRLQRAMQRIISETRIRTLIVTHSMCLRVILSRLIHDDLNHMVDYESDNMSLYLLGEDKKDCFKVSH